MALIEAVALTKEFRHARKAEGWRGAVRGVLAPAYETKVAVQGLDLAIEAGEAVAYVGPNGAGKSTTVKMLAGILVPTSGHIAVNGLVPHRQRIDNSRNVGAVFGQRTQLWWDIPIAESFSLLRAIYGVGRPRFQENMSRLTEALGLGDFLHLPARKLSLGQRMRADIAAALLHDPLVVYLDEPTIGLDLAVRDSVRVFIRELVQDRGTTVVLTTHNLDDIEKVCDRIAIIDQGKLIFDGSLEALRNRFARDRVMHFQLAAPVHSVKLHADLQSLGEVEGFGTAELKVTFDRERCSAERIASAVMSVTEVADFRLVEPTIEDVIRQFYTRDPFGTGGR
jgi:ABC-2 type transport system ATP-binding protein